MERTNIPYLSLNPDIEAAIRADRAAGRAHPHRFDDANVVRRERNPHDNATLTRPAFARDIEKILNVPAYNRYADKTQVFSFVENDDICRRGLHVQLVSRVARGIGSLLGLNCELIEAIALGHDVGHTPFGHAGERYLSACYHARTGRYFNHNVHSVRVLDQLYRRNVSLQTLDGVLCHNGEFAQQVLRMGDTADFAALDALVEACNADERTIKTLRPSTLEGCVVRVSDMIAYVGKDRADALDMGVIDSLDVFDSEVIGRDNARIINNLTVDLVNTSYGTDRIALSEEAFADLKRAKRQNYELIYEREGMVNGAGNIVEEMFEELYERLLEDLLAGDEGSPVFKHHAASLAAKSRTVEIVPGIGSEPGGRRLHGLDDRQLLHGALRPSVPEKQEAHHHARLLLRFRLRAHRGKETPVKLLIASDLHGAAPAVRALVDRIEAEAPDRIVLLGDLLYHGPRNDLPEGYAPKEAIALLNGLAKRIVAVRGNCDAEVDQMVLDFPCMADYALVEADGHVLYLSHGHLPGKSPDDPPTLAPGSAFLSGHTHAKTLDERDGVLFVNPGSTSIPKDGSPSYAVYEHGTFTLKDLDGNTLREGGWE